MFFLLNKILYYEYNLKIKINFKNHIYFNQFFIFRNTISKSCNLNAASQNRAIEKIEAKIACKSFKKINLTSN